MSSPVEPRVIIIGSCLAAIVGLAILGWNLLGFSLKLNLDIQFNGTYDPPGAFHSMLLGIIIAVIIALVAVSLASKQILVRIQKVNK